MENSSDIEMVENEEEIKVLSSQESSSSHYQKN